MDAFAHCLEAFSSPHYHPMSHGIALEGMRLVKENLTAVYDDPATLPDAHMMSAAMMGATAFRGLERSMPYRILLGRFIIPIMAPQMLLLCRQ